MQRLVTGIAVGAALLLAAFFGFVGWHKAFSPLAELAQHKVWTLALPELAGRAIGWSELALALGLAAMLRPQLRHLGRFSALALIINQAVAAAVHLSRGETDALPQNGVLVALLCLVAFATRTTEAQGERR